MRVLVIPDCHLKLWMFENAAEIIRDGKADRAVCLMDLPDDFGKDDMKLYVDTYDAAINFAKEFPETLWCYGNHDLSYVWGKPESGYHPWKKQKTKLLFLQTKNRQEKDTPYHLHLGRMPDILRRKRDETVKYCHSML